MKASLLFCLFAALICSCSNSNIFAPNEDAENIEPLNGPSGQTTIEMQITGGFAGVNQQLLIDANRYVRFIEFHSQNRQIETILSVEEYSALVALFVEKDFLHINSSYLDARVADAFHYRLLFRHGGSEKQVETDYLSAPPELRAIIDRLLGIVDTLLNKSLALEFKTSADTLRHGEKLTLTLIATNRSASPLTLQFRDGQIYDFFAVQPSAVANAFSFSFIWNWAHDKFFIQVLRSETLQAGASRTYSVEWDGRSNKGDLLVGDFLVGARLVSIPGGYAPMRRVVVME